jgi:hypothetical protein
MAFGRSGAALLATLSYTAIHSRPLTDLVFLSQRHRPSHSLKLPLRIHE